jgi:NAD(P)H-hydrate epimerase
VHVVCGKGNNGADGRVAADLLRERGVRVLVHDAAWAPPAIADGHLVIDAAYGTGFRGVWEPPQVGDIPVLAVDIPSGVDAATGAVSGRVLAATRTVTFQALKPGHVLPPGRWMSGEVVVADIGLDTSRAQAHVVDAAAVAAWLPQRPVDAHKWHAAVRMVAGSQGMTGAAALAARAAMRSGAGMVHLSAVGALVVDAPVEVVQKPLAAGLWAATLVQSAQRFHSFVVGPGIGRDDATTEQARRAIVDMPLPTVIDGDGLFALAWSAQGAAALLRSRTLPTVLTPHDGEYQTLAGRAPGPDRLAAARSLAGETGAVVLLKGASTVVAHPDGRVLVVTNGDQRLATAGTGDVMSGVIGALLARGVDAFEAAAAGAWLHADALRCLPADGVIASDLIDGLRPVLEVQSQ